MTPLSVWKYPLSVQDEVTISMPAGALVLTVGAQSDAACLWALVDPTLPLEPRRFRVAGTGHMILDGDRARYVGTFHLLGGSFVGHVFEMPQR